ncbi:MAG: isochorismatase family protein [Planctomycetota bacterium]|nr:isochorismatase family protein [Planctomycetota bacterium]
MHPIASRVTVLATCVTALGLAIAAGVSGESARESQPSTRTSAPIAGITRQPSPAARAVLLDPNDTVVLLLDHQTGLFQTVKDVPLAELRSNTVALANIARLGKAPVIYTASEPDGPNGPIMQELDSFKDYATYVPRKGEISAWDNADFVKAVEATGRKTLVIAGVWTSVCVAFPALQAHADGYKVYFVTDASGDPSVLASQTTIARLSAAGITPVSTNAVLCEFQRTWNRPDAGAWGAIYTQVVPHYKAAMESYMRAQDAARKAK